MKKWNPYILPPEKKEYGLRRAFWIALWTVLIAILFMMNKYYFQISFDFAFGSQPKTIERKTDDSRQTALRTQVIIEYPAVRYRNKPS